MNRYLHLGIVILTLSACSRDEGPRQPGAFLPMTGATMPPAAPDVVASAVETTEPPTESGLLPSGTPVEDVALGGGSGAGRAAASLSIAGISLGAPAKAALPAVLAEVNRLRRNPSAYADRLARLRTSRGVRFPSGKNAAPREGWRVVDETIRVLRRTPRLPPLSANSRLARSASAHVADRGPIGGMGHTSTNGQSFAQRIRRYVPGAHVVGEVILYGRVNIEETVMMWMIDDGVYDRGHRRNLLSPKYDDAGYGSGPHARYGEMQVVDFASNP